eukprot:296303-Chlamydomonas_euryale.AAC.1
MPSGPICCSAAITLVRRPGANRCCWTSGAVRTPQAAAACEVCAASRSICAGCRAGHAHRIAVPSA